MNLRPDTFETFEKDEYIAHLESLLASKTSECDAAQRKIMALKREEKRSEKAFDSAVDTINLQTARILVLEALLNTPELENFSKGVVTEAQHQRARWGATHDAGKTDLDWFWLIGYLSQKVVHAQSQGDRDKALHHCISTAAAMANWHSAISGAHTDMRPGLSEEVTKDV